MDDDNQVGGWSKKKKESCGWWWFLINFAAAEVAIPKAAVSIVHNQHNRQCHSDCCRCVHRGHVVVVLRLDGWMNTTAMFSAITGLLCAVIVVSEARRSMNGWMEHRRSSLIQLPT
jgi:hypothetical protein